MAVNTETLIHFTNKIDNLFSILQGDFLPHMSLEDFSFLAKNKDRQKAAIPIVCFCDIPLHLVSSHMAEYGQYGIGLSKEWGIRSGLNPVIYVKEGSSLHESLFRIKDHLFYYGPKDRQRSTAGDRLAWELLTFVKPYEGTSHKTNKKKIFYDECEWRYSPGIFHVKDKTRRLPLLFESTYEENKETLNNILGKFPLRFNLNDIKYIIVKKEKDIIKAIRKIDEIKTEKYSKDELDVLKTKILCAKYMVDDF